MGTATPVDRAHGEVANLITAATSVLRAATVRCETRGAHARSDHPEPSELWRHRIVHDAEGVAVLHGPGLPGDGAL
jgi:aspartate oxidase